MRALLAALTMGLLFTLSPGSYTGHVAVFQKEPPMPHGVVLKALDSLPVPAALKTNAMNEISDMSSKGYVITSEEAVIYLERMKDTAALQPLNNVQHLLKIKPANLQPTPFAQMKALGAIPSGAYTDKGWTALQRIFQAPGSNLFGLEEIDYAATGGGLLMIKEAVNQDINGFPGILRVKKSNSNRSTTELTWATSKKIYTLSTNRDLTGDATTNEFLALAKSIKE